MRIQNSYAAAAAAAIAAVVFSAAFQSSSARAVTIDWVTVGDPGNTADTTTYGAVADSFQIMTYEFTNDQYTEFLNSVDPNGTNPNSVYNSQQGTDTFRGGISFTPGASTGSKYAAKPNFGNKPVNYVSWFDAARVSNWLMNGATGTSSTETGAYTLSSGTTGSAPAVNSGATFFVPTEDQWYKAAYYKGGGTNAGYWEYATQVTGTAPTLVLATAIGTGSSGGVSPLTSGNFANYIISGSGAAWNGTTSNVTTVGTNGGVSAYDAYDMNGNIYELTDSGDATTRRARGGSFFSVAASLQSSGTVSFGAAFERNSLGFRLAAPVPEPSTWVMAAGGIACVAWRAFRRRKQA